jgi:hypothetical protein
MGKKKSIGRGGIREGAGRPVGKEGKAVVVAASVPGSLVERLDAYATSKCWTRSKAVQEAIRCLVSRSRS